MLKELLKNEIVFYFTKKNMVYNISNGRKFWG